MSLIRKLKDTAAGDLKTKRHSCVLNKSRENNNIEEIVLILLGNFIIKSQCLMFSPKLPCENKCIFSNDSSWLSKPIMQLKQSKSFQLDSSLIILIIQYLLRIKYYVH